MGGSFYDTKMKYILLSFLWTSFIYCNTNSSQQERALSVFTVVKFPNTVCASSTSGRNGTCYTQSECTSKGGSASGACASSFGVCCVFEKTCGAGSISENCTYFTSSGRSAGSSCSLTICKSSSDVCQLRLDFEAFSLSQPVTSTAGQHYSNPATVTLIGTRIGNCDTDFFSVGVPGGQAPPLICGSNSGQHMYVPASDQCNPLTSYFGSATTTTTSAFTIKVLQVKCNSKLRAPENCLQYLTASSGTITAYNWNSGAGPHLANQDYCVCLRSDRTACTLCMSTSTNPTVGTTHFGIGGTAPTIGGAAGGAVANLEGYDTMCGWALGMPHAHAAITTNIATMQSRTDFIVFPGGQCDVTSAGSVIAYQTVDRYCGSQFLCAGTLIDAANTAHPTAATAALLPTVCSSAKPFKFCFKSDAAESSTATAANNAEVDFSPSQNGWRGWSFDYWQKSTCLFRN